MFKLIHYLNTDEDQILIKYFAIVMATINVKAQLFLRIVLTCYFVELIWISSLASAVSRIIVTWAVIIIIAVAITASLGITFTVILLHYKKNFKEECGKHKS